MDFQLSPEQTMLRDSVAAALERADADRWGNTLGELGVLGMFLPEADGGAGLGATEATLVAFEAGYRAGTFPVAETMAAMPALARARPGALAAALSGGRPVTAPASASATWSGKTLRGTAIVPYLAVSTHVAVALDDTCVAIVDAEAIASSQRAALDLSVPNTRASLDGAAAHLTEDDAFASRLTLLRAADMAGAACFCFETAVQYLKDRTQFGRPIGANQALKHIAAEDFVRLEGAKVAIEYAAAALDRATAEPTSAECREDAARALAVVCAYVPDAARRIGENAVQLHGGIGATWEYRLNGHLRRILRLGAAIGSPDRHRMVLADSLLGDKPTGRRSFEAAAE